MSMPALPIDDWMRRALHQAQIAADRGEVPVGAAVFGPDGLLAADHNRTEQLADPCAHAEILALRAAGRAVGDWRLEGCTLVVTLEPCPMCIGAIVMARIDRLVYGAPDPRYGACGSALPLLEPALTPHLREIRSGVLRPECTALLKSFFRELRER